MNIIEMLTGGMAWVPAFMLVMVRVSAMLTTFPVFSYQAVNVRVRVLFTLLLSAIIVPLVGSAGFASLSGSQLLVLSFRETFIGLFIGFGTNILFETILFGGELAGRQIGLGMAQMMDPNTQMRGSLIGQFWFLFFLVIFITFGMHYYLLEVIIRNFQIIPVGGGMFPPALGQLVVEEGGNIFHMALRLAAPIIVIMLLIDTAIALMARIMPSLPIFIIALPAKIGIGVYLIGVSLDLFQTLFDTLFINFKELVENIIRLIGG